MFGWIGLIIATKSSNQRKFTMQDSVEFVLTPQHETSCDSEIQIKKDFKKQVHKATWKLANSLIK